VVSPLVRSCRTVESLELLFATVQIPMIVGFGEGGDWGPAGADDGSEPQSVSS
jgi:hypothetical protein